MSDRSRFPRSYDNDLTAQSMRLGQLRYGKPRDLDALAAETPKAAPPMKTIPSATPDRVSLAKPIAVSFVETPRPFPRSVLAGAAVFLASVAIGFLVEDQETRTMVVVCGFIAGCAVLGVLQAASHLLRGRS